jgi:rhodanese-related sulfurtransferase
VRTARSWDKSTQKIKCSKRVDPDNISSWAGTLPKDKEIVLYCT